MAVMVKTNRHGHLALQIRHNGWKRWIGTRQADSPAARTRLARVAEVIKYDLDRGRRLRDSIRDHLGLDPMGALPDDPVTSATPIEQTIGEYAETWLARQVPPLLTVASARNRKFIITRIVLPRWGTLGWDTVSAESLSAWRAELLAAGRAVGYVKGVITGHFRALFRDARLAAKASSDAIGLPAPRWTSDNPFQLLTWKDHSPAALPDPMTPEEKATLLEYLRARDPHWYPFILWLLEVGTRPSEATALRVGDLDLDAGLAYVRRSRVGRREREGTKTAGSHRQTVVWPWVADVLRGRLSSDPQAYVFSTVTGLPVAQEYVRYAVWVPALAACGIRRRRLYCARHTAISAALSAGERALWVAENFGTSTAVIERHYSRWIGQSGGAALIASRSNQSQTRPPTQEKSELFQAFQ